MEYNELKFSASVHPGFPRGHNFKNIMKIKLAKYIARLLVQNGVSHCFCVVGGGAMHLNDGFGHEPGLKTLYMHHEQACAMAAESYARIYNKPALLCVTTGPGGSNAITGVMGAWLDSIPMIVISGQVRQDNTARSSQVGIRAMGDQEYDITRAIDCMVKYSSMILDPMSIRYEVEKCLYLAQTGRPGPCWLDIPVDIQGMYIEDTALCGFDPGKYLEEIGTQLDKIDADESLSDISFRKQKIQRAPMHISKDDVLITKILKRLETAKRPVFYTGNGIRIAGAHKVFLQAADLLGIPVVVGWNGIDIIPEDHPLKAGQPGGRGDRPGNLAVQNADFILSVGSRLSIRQVGYNFSTWARGAFTVVCDIDEEELKKPSVHIDIPVHADAYEFLKALTDRLIDMGIKGHGPDHMRISALEKISYADGLSFFKGGQGKRGRNWIEQCHYWMQKYNPYEERFMAHGDNEPANVYAFLRTLSLCAQPGQITVVGNGSPCVAGAQVYKIKEGTRFISQDAVAAMGYDLPAAIGACMATHDIDPYVYKYDNPPRLAGRKDDIHVGSAISIGTKDDIHGDPARSIGTKNDTYDGPAGSAGTKDDIYDGHITSADIKVADKAFALGELEKARKSPWWVGRGEHFPHYYNHDIILPTGDGSIMMNLQELQTIASHQMPIKIFLINNGGYHSIRQTQTNLFEGEPLVGVGVDSRDLSFPDFEKIAWAFGIRYKRIEHNSQMKSVVEEALAMEGPVLTEVFVSIDQPFEPSNSAKKLADGSITSPPLEDMSPFLSDEEMDENMFIPRVKE